jgi:hypothetical protein
MDARYFSDFRRTRSRPNMRPANEGVEKVTSERCPVTRNTGWSWPQPTDTSDWFLSLIFGLIRHERASFGPGAF